MGFFDSLINQKDRRPDDLPVSGIGAGKGGVSKGFNVNGAFVVLDDKYPSVPVGTVAPQLRRLGFPTLAYGGLDWSLLADTLTLPLGPEPGHCYLILTRDQLNKISGARAASSGCCDCGVYAFTLSGLSSGCDGNDDYSLEFTGEPCVWTGTGANTASSAVLTGPAGAGSSATLAITTAGGCQATYAGEVDGCSVIDLALQDGATGGPWPATITVSCVSPGLAAVPAGLDALHTITFALGNDLIEFVDWVVSRSPVCISPAGVEDPTAIYLVELADPRHLAQNSYFATPLARAYNVPAPDGGWVTDNNAASYSLPGFYDDTTNGGVPWTWQYMLDDIWSVLTASVAPFPALSPQLPPDPDNPAWPSGVPVGWRFEGVDAWAAYNQVLDRLSCAFAWNPDGTCEIVQTGQADSANSVAVAQFRKWPSTPRDDAYLSTTRYRVPGRLVVYNPKVYEQYGQEPVLLPAPGQWAADPAAHATATTVDAPADVLVDPDTAASVWDDLPALVRPDGTVDNLADVVARARERADDYYRSVSGGRTRRLYTGFLTHPGFWPGSLVTAVRWARRAGETDGPFGGCKTEVLYCPYLLWKDRGAGDPFDPPASELNLPHDLGRKTFPVYPPREYQVQVLSSSPVVASYYLANLLRYDVVSDQFLASGDCWARPLNNAALTQGVSYPADLIGQAYSKPLLAVGDGAGSGGGTVFEVVNADGTEDTNPASVIVLYNDMGAKAFGRMHTTDQGDGTAVIDWQGLRLYKSGTGYVGPEPDIEFIAGAGTTILIADDPADQRVQVTISVTGVTGSLDTINADATQPTIPTSTIVLNNDMGAKAFGRLHTTALGGGTALFDWQGLRLYKFGAGYVGPEPDIEFLDGPGILISIADDPLNELVQATVRCTVPTVVNVDNTQLTDPARVIKADNDLGAFAFGRIHTTDLGGNVALLDWQGLRIYKSGVGYKGPEPDIEFIAGAGVAIVIADAVADRRVQVTISATGTSGVNTVNFDATQPTSPATTIVLNNDMGAAKFGRLHTTDEGAGVALFDWQGLRLWKFGTGYKGPEPDIEFLDGAGIHVTIDDDPLNELVQVHVASTLEVINDDGTQSTKPATVIKADNDLLTYAFGRIHTTDLGGGVALLDWQGLRLYKSGTGYVGPEPDIEFIAGAGVAIAIADDVADQRVQVTISNTAPAPALAKYETYFRTITGGQVGDRWYLAGEPSDWSNNTGALTGDTIYALPFLANRAGATIDKIAFFLSVNFAGNVRIGIYGNLSDTDLYPNNLIFDSGNIPCAAGAPVLKTAAAGLAAGVGKLYWFVLLSDVGTMTSILGVNPHFCWPILGIPNTWASPTGIGFAVAFAFAALPLTYPAGATILTSSSPSAPAVGAHYST